MKSATMQAMRPHHLCALVSSGILALAAPAPATVQIVASIFPLADIVQQLGQDAAAVTTLLPPGASPHTFEPTPAQIRGLVHADLFVRIGAGLDNWTDKLRDAQRPGLRVITASDEITLIGPSGTARDPHVWLDPVLVRDHIVPVLTAALAQSDPAHRAVFERAASEFCNTLTSLDTEIQRILAPLSSRDYIAFHSAWRYFGRRYGLQEIAAVEPFPGKEPSARDMAQLIERARNAHVRALLVEPQFPVHLAEQIAHEFGGRTVQVDPLGGAGVTGRDHYISLMRYNAEMFAQALR